MVAQEEAAAAKLDALAKVLAAEAASQLEVAHKQRATSESIAAAEAAQKRALELQLIDMEEKLRQQQLQLKQQQQDIERLHEEINRPGTVKSASSPSKEDPQIGGVGSRWSRVMKEQVRSQQKRW